MNDTERQRQLEMTSVSRGVERYFNARDLNRERGRQWDDGVEGDVVSQMVTAMIPAVVAYQKECRARLVEAQTTGRRISGYEMPIVLSDPASAAYITVRTVLGGTQAGRKKIILARSIGTIMNQELRWLELRAAESERAKSDPPNRLAYLKKTVKSINPKSLAKWLRKMDDIATTLWSNEQRVRVGLEMLGLMAGTCDKWVTVERFKQVHKGAFRTLVNMKPTEEVLSAIERRHMERANEGPWVVPMVCPPTPWYWDENGGGYAGGYFTTFHPLVKSGMETHTSFLDQKVPETCLNSLNAIQATRWTINEEVRQLCEHVVSNRVAEVSPVEPEKDLPPFLSESEWNSTPPVRRTELSAARRAIHDSNNKLANERDAVDRVLAVARDFKDEDVIYFPHNLDFRGRAYPLPQDLHPQGRDFARALLKFANTVPLGKTGLRWLVYHTANTYGMDKATREEQFAWALDNMDGIASVARDPLGRGFEFWSKADEPWQFYAAALELEEAFNYPGGAENYPSALPVSVDGSCNGLQHLSAMGLDPVGAHATNLTADPERQDIYQIVADKVARRVHDDVYDDTGTSEAVVMGNVWLGRVNRKVVKRGVMTTPYGVTHIGMRDQLINDKMTKDVKEANYLRDLMKDAIADTVVKGREIMDWMQDNAKICAANNNPVEWTAPSGFKVRQGYYNAQRKRVNTLIGCTYLTSSNGAHVDARKQTLAIAPNMIHSFDAAHMMLTVEEGQHRGIRSYAVVHDSFGCHAAQMDQLVSIVREEFVKIYQNNWFSTLQWGFQQSAGQGVPLIQPPERGDFDITEVLDAQFFFA